MKKVTAVFDIGKTNKKFFLFDIDYREVYREYIRFEEVKDEDGYPAENLKALEIWTKEVFHRMLDSPNYEIEAINFSCYGASLVHIEENGKILGPLYNYMKPLKDEIYNSFYKKYDAENGLSRITGSPKLGMLNAGMHLYWLKYTKPNLFKKIKYSLHLPQYLSYIFTGIPVSDYTSIGCHTMLWDYEKKDYHRWVYEEEIDKILPPIVATKTFWQMEYNGKSLRVGAGIHDSSAALLPYMRSLKKRFILVSTGTWSISINPFAKGVLSTVDIKKECLFNMRVDGSPVKVSRLFLGNEYKLQIKVLSNYFRVPADYHKLVKFDSTIFFNIKADFQYLFKWISISGENLPTETKIPYDSFEHAYHHLMIELVQLQVNSITMAKGEEHIKNLYIDGGFSDNEIYIKLLTHYLPDMKLHTTDSSLGSALGAAIVMSNSKLDSKFLKNNYSLKRHVPLFLK